MQGHRKPLTETLLRQTKAGTAARSSVRIFGHIRRFGIRTYVGHLNSWRANPWDTDATLGFGGELLQSPEGRLEDGQGDVVLALVPGGTGEEAGLDTPEAVLPYQCLDRFGRVCYDFEA